MDNLHFSEEEIQEQLAALGYKNIPKHRLCEFKQDLDDLVRRGEWKSLTSSAQMNPATSQPSPPAFTKEKVLSSEEVSSSAHSSLSQRVRTTVAFRERKKHERLPIDSELRKTQRFLVSVGHCYFQSSGEGFFLHARKVDPDGRVLTSCQNRDCERQQGRCDSYARHSVALNLRLPPGAPSRLQVEEEEPDETLHPPLTDSYASTPDSHRGRFIKRKVLRKHKGQSLVCDESVYSEEAFCLHRPHTSAGVQVANMYKVYSTQRDDDKNSLSSSFWSDGDRREGEEDEEEKVVIGEGDFKPVGNAEESYNDASGKEVEIGKEDSKAVGVSEDSYREASEEEGVEIERVIREEDSKPVGDAEDSLQDSSEEEEEEKEEESNPLSDSENSYQEDSEEDGVEIERVISEGDSKPSGDAEDYLQEASEEENDSKPPGNSEDSHQEEEEEIERVISEEDSKPVGDGEDSLQESLEEEEDSNPLSDSEDSYQEDSEEDGVEIERVISEEDSKPVGDGEESLQESLEEEEDSNPLSDSEDSYQEDSEEEGVEIERVISEEESKPVGDAEDYLQEEEEDSNPLSDSEDSYQEEGVEIERAISEEDSKPSGDAGDYLQEEEEDFNPLSDSEDSHQEASEEEKFELNNQVNISGESLEGGNNDDDEEERCSSSSDSPAPSLMTSGYGTYKPEELEGGDYRDDHTITEFDQDSRGDLSEMRDDEEDDRSLCSFGWFDLKPTEPDYIETEADVTLCGDDDLQKEVDITATKPEEDKDQANEETFEVDLHAMSEDEVTNATSEERQFCNTVVEDKVDVKNSEGGSDDQGDKQYEMLEEDVRDGKEETEIEEKVELEDPDESSSNKDIKFIDSKVDFSQTTFDKMCEDWEGNLRQTKASCLEERLADLHLSSSAQRDFETEIEDVSGQSDTQSSETDGVSFSAFESYIRGMTRTQSDGDLRPKPKSFIRPVMSQQTLKKTDPVAKYFEYKQHWAMHKVPGEDERRSERREIKERLAYRPPPPKPRRVYLPNTYVVPTEKKRSALCWRIRNDLANGLLPHKFSHEF